MRRGKKFEWRTPRPHLDRPLQVLVVYSCRDVGHGGAIAGCRLTFRNQGSYPMLCWPETIRIGVQYGQCGCRSNFFFISTFAPLALNILFYIIFEHYFSSLSLP